MKFELENNISNSNRAVIKLESLNFSIKALFVNNPNHNLNQRMLFEINQNLISDFQNEFCSTYKYSTRTDFCINGTYIFLSSSPFISIRSFTFLILQKTKKSKEAKKEEPTSPVATTTSTTAATITIITGRKSISTIIQVWRFFFPYKLTQKQNNVTDIGDTNHS